MQKHCFHCDNCGAEVPLNAKACHECGADTSTGLRGEGHGDWSDDFDYDDFVRREFGPQKPNGIAWKWWLTALILLVLLIWTAMRGAPFV